MAYRTGIIGISALLCSCATTPWPQLQAQKQQIEATRPTCAGDKDCQVKWEAAQLYVFKKADYMIQTATSALIATWPSRHRDIAMTVTKEPMGGGQYRLVANAWCGSLFGCKRPPEDVVLAFNKTVGAAAP